MPGDSEIERARASTDELALTGWEVVVGGGCRSVPPGRADGE